MTEAASVVNDSNISSEPEVKEKPTSEPVVVESIPANEPEEKGLSDLPLPDPDGDEISETDKSRWPKGFEDRLLREKNKREALSRETEELREKLNRVSSVPSIPDQSNAQAVNPEYVPNRDDYETDYEFITAVNQHQNALAQQVHMKQQRLQSEVSFIDSVQKVRNTGGQVYPDFKEKTDFMFQQGFPANRAMAEAIIDSDHKSDIFYFLGTYPEEARKIALMNPIQAIKKVAEIEARFESKKKANISKAPKPLDALKSIGGSAAAGGSAVVGNPESMNQPDFERWYKEKYSK